MYTSIHCHSFDPKKSALEIHSSLPRIMIISQKIVCPYHFLSGSNPCSTTSCHHDGVLIMIDNGDNT